MAISVNQNEDVKSISFPILMAAPHFDKIQIILVKGISPHNPDNFEGTNINGVGWPIGHYSEGWSNSFKPYYGIVTLQTT